MAAILSIIVSYPGASSVLVAIPYVGSCDVSSLPGKWRAYHEEPVE
ncbi:MAG: hypothetical protein OJF49_001032 [Ktedonobacterales bacterium]|nr:MAG: hypothetical protein OJF49_001032 [Ktedonobacterales bacterium]